MIYDSKNVSEDNNSEDTIMLPRVLVENILHELTIVKIISLS